MIIGGDLVSQNTYISNRVIIKNNDNNLVFRGGLYRGSSSQCCWFRHGDNDYSIPGNDSRFEGGNPANRLFPWFQWLLEINSIGADG